MRGWGLGSALMLVLIGCSDAGGGQNRIEATNTSASAIVDGTRDDGSPPRFPFVGQLQGFSDNSYSRCTGTLISCGAIITAGHCLHSTAFEADRASLQLDSETDTGAYPTRIIGGSNFVFHPEFEPPSAYNPTARQISRDVVIIPVTGKTNASNQETAERRQWAHALLPAANQAAVALPVTLVGYGWGGQYPNGECHFEEDEEYLLDWKWKYRWHRRWADMVVDAIADDSLLGAITFTSGSSGAKAAEGDSGGPLLLFDDTTIVGVQSSLSSGCASSRAYAVNLTDPSVNAWVRGVLDDLDRDGDGASDVCDLCPDTPDNGLDSDGDFIPDACDPCPYDPDPVDVADSDGDGICNINAPDGGGDNCPNVSNGQQENANLEVELVNGAVPVGDACEPVPAPLFEPRLRFQEEECRGDGSFEWTVCRSRYGLDDNGPNLTFAPRGSFTYMPVPPITDPNSGGDEHPVGVDRTDLRYCVYEQDQADCFASEAINEDLLQIAYPDENLATLFHRVEVNEIPPTLSSIGSSQYASSEPDRNLSWDWGSDFERWRTSAWGSSWVPDPQPEFETLALNRGRFWMHGATDVGMKNAAVAWKNLTGIHPSEVDPGGAEKLANHYESVFPSEDRILWDYHKVLHDEGFQLWSWPCLDCGRITLESLLDQLDDPIDEDLWYGPLDARPITMIGDNLGVVIPDGRAVQLSEDRVPAPVRQLLGGDHVMVPYAEANPRLGMGQRGAEYVVLAANGTRIVDEVFTDGMRFTTGGERALTVAETNAGAPSPRTDFVAVYSRSSARVFIVGGQDGDTGEPTGEIWQRAVTHGESWMQLPHRGFAPGKVIAATYSYRDRHLWILDEVDTGHHLALARLTRVNAGTGEAEVLRTWPRLKRFEKHWLMLDGDGGVLLFASSAHTQAYWVFKLDPDDGTLVGMRRSKGMLAARPFVDPGGYSLLWQRRAADRPIVVRKTDLDLVPAAWQAVGGCL